MGVVKNSLACLVFLLAGFNVGVAKQWRGLTPLKSTRDDVVRLLGHSNESCDCLYNLDTQIVSINYSLGPCRKDSANGWNVPRDTVISILISFRPGSQPLLTELGIDEVKYQKVADPLVLDNTHYTNKDEGETITAYDGRVKYIEYGPAAKDAGLRCAELAPVAASEEGPVTYPLAKIDVYGDIPFEQEKRRLDLLAAAIENKSGTRAYIIVYAGRRAHRGEAQERAARDLSYLLKEHAIDMQRVVAVDGGYREDLTIEIWVGSTAAPAPTPSPTLRREEVQLIKNKRLASASTVRDKRHP